MAVSNTNGVAIGQGTADGSSPFPAGGADFFSPNVTIVGDGTIHGSAGSFRMCATEITPNTDYVEKRQMVTIGNLTIGDGVTPIHMDGSIEMKLFDKDFGTANVAMDNCAYTIGSFTLDSGSSISGHVLLDAAIAKNGVFSGSGSCILINDITINGDIAGKVEDTYGVCVALTPWADDGSISPVVGAVTIAGSITANVEHSGNYVGLFVDAPSSQSAVISVEISGNINTGNDAGDGTRIGTIVHTPVIGGFAASGSISGKDAAIVFDGSEGAILEVPITLNSNATLQSGKMAIGGRNANLHFANGNTLNAESTARFAIAPCVPTYAYNNGATDVTALEIFATETDSAEKLSSINSAKLALLRGSNLSLQVDANASFNANGMDIAVTGLELGEASAITCGTLFLGGAAGIGSGALHVADGIIFCPDASVDASRTASKLSVTMAENVFGIISSEDAFTGVPKIDASFAAVGDDTNPYGAAIDISTLSVSAILPEGIRGNLSDGSEFSAATAERYASVELGGEGGSIGTESVATSGVSDVGKLVINGSSNDSVWTIHGNTSCGTLRIEKGKMVQKGNLTVWGDLLLLGCDIDWTGAASFNHVYAEEDKITVREGATVKIANGFSAENVGVEPITLEDVQLKQEAVLLGGNSQFIVEPNTTVSIGVAGCDESKFGTANEPVGIRVVGNSLKLGEALRQWPKDGQIIGNGNVIDLHKSLNLHYYTSGGTRITPESNKKVTAIRGNETTRLFLNGGTTGAQNHLPGIISNVGHVTVNGYWNVPNGLDECGHLTLGPSGQLNCAGADVNTYLITFRLDGPRNRNSGDVEKVPYLVCSKLYNTYEDGSVPVCFNLELSDNLLSDANSFEFCLVAGLSVQPQWVCGTKINGIKPTISFANDKLMATIPGIMANDVTRNVEFAAPDEYAMRNFWERGLLIPYSVHQANITRKQNDLFRHALGPGNGNFANAGGKNWHLTRTSYVSLLRRGRAGPIINAVSANTTGSTIGLKRKLPQGHLLAVSADYAVSHAHFRVWNNSKSYRCRMKSHGLGAGGRFVNGPMRFGLTGVVNENSNRYGWEMGRLANVRFNGYSYNLAGNFSYALPYGKWTISPRLEGSFDNIYHKNYAIDNGNMNISPCRTKFFQGALGIHASVHEENWQFIGDLSLCHDFQCSGGFSTATSTRTSFITMPAYFPRRDRIDGKLQVSIPWRKSCEFAFDCAATLQRHSWDSSITIGSIYYF
ncbi:MAG: autotransporter outer membrane beta-barrel domain-containing protein [Puniceicoccales bacterium]|nr:autotransporter outer membrane beta-barrel domain-containing protein [Puniceicoccales bacterium]